MNITMTSCSTMHEPQAKNDTCLISCRNLKYNNTCPIQQNNCSRWQQKWRSSRWSTEHCLNRIIRTTTSIHGTRVTTSWRIFGRNTCQKTSNDSEICSNRSETNCVHWFTRLDSCVHRNEANKRLTNRLIGCPMLRKADSCLSAFLSMAFCIGIRKGVCYEGV